MTSTLVTYVASKLTPRVPWSAATIVGWAALAIGTVVTIVIVVSALTLP